MYMVAMYHLSEEEEEHLYTWLKSLTECQ
jgi:hypothetical protein